MLNEEGQLNMSHDEMIAVIQAHKEGKQIQYRSLHSKSWRDCAENRPAWEFNANNYRVKPEPRKPREWWVSNANSPTESAYYLVTPSSPDPNRNAFIHVREVMEGEQ